MNAALRADLNVVVARHLDKADDRQFLSIVSALYGKPEQEAPAPAASSGAAGVPGNARFEVLGEIVRDHETKLEWTRAASITEKRVSWQEASDACAKLELAGGGWRLPTRKELLTLVDDTRHEPAIDAQAFECKSDWYWTGTPWAASPAVFAWFVYFGYGYADYCNRDSSGFVRAVRGGQF